MTAEKKINTEDLQKKLEECEKLKSEYLAGWQRERADFLNYKKEEMERIEDLLKYAGTELTLKFLPILDNFEIAEKNLSDELKQNESVKGILQIKTQILDFLKNQGLEEIESVGEKFDPNFHEVAEVVEIPASAGAAAGKKNKESGPEGIRGAGIIIEEIQKGYKIQGRLLRPAKVKVSK